MTDKLETGKDILAYCLKCKLNLAHTIVSMVEDEIGKVKCNTCGSGPKKFRPPKEKKEPKKSRATKKAKKNLPLSLLEGDDSDIKLWTERKKATDITKPLPYSISNSYQVNDCIDHSKFGIGFIDKLDGNKRVEVLFEEGRKLLIMNHKQ